MPKIILLPATGTATDSSVFASALAAARLFDGHLMVLHVRPDVRREIAAMASADMGMATGLDSTISNMEAEADTRERAAESTWRAFAAAHGIKLAERPCSSSVMTYEWLTETGSAADWLAEYGRISDLVVVGRERQGGALSMDLMEAALMETGKPVLIAPDEAPNGLDGTVAIAWKNTKEAAGAITAALPFFRWSARVIVFTVDEDGEAKDKSHLRLVSSLRWHNPNVSLQVLQRQGRSPVTVLLEAVSKAHCNLLVMGGYGHTRLREAVFGGFTRAVLEQAPVTVLMAH
jgi:nucleotide-binding universal stress UspA family protein